MDAGEKTVEQIADILVSLFDVNPWDLELMRVDLAADVDGVPVSWFQDHAFVNRKRQMEFRCETGWQQSD